MVGRPLFVLLTSPDAALQFPRRPIASLIDERCVVLHIWHVLTAQMWLAQVRAEASETIQFPRHPNG